MSLDKALFLVVLELTGNPVLDKLMFLFAETLVFLVPLSLLYLWFQGREEKEVSILTFSTAVVGLIVSYLIGFLYFHPNPSALYDTIVAPASENAFPSQHTTAILSPAFYLLWKKRKKLSTLLLVSGALTGFARIYVGEHFPLDILGAFLASLIGLGIVYSLEGPVEPAVNKIIDLSESVRAKVTG
ncbi:MAG: undecaprenyl-diphosphatase [Candidatus Aenigmatarchaeota archaeon]